MLVLLALAPPVGGASQATPAKKIFAALILLGHGIGPSTPPLRAPVAESSNPGIKPFYGYFPDAATARSMTGARGMTEGSMTGGMRV